MAEHIHEAEMLTRKLGDQPRRTRILTLRSNQCQAVGDYDEAVRFGQEALTIARAVGDRGREMVVTMAQGVTHIVRGELRDAAILLERIIELGGDLRHERLAARSRAHLADVLSQFRRLDEAIGHAETAVQIAEAAAPPATLYFTLLDLRRVHLRRAAPPNGTPLLD